MKYCGVDGCRSGWFWVKLRQDSEEWKVGISQTFSSLVRQLGDCAGIFVDIPIGLPDGDIRRRQCDVEARKRLLPWRASSVFPAISRSALEAESYQEAVRLNRQSLGVGISRQSFHIAGKVREVDRLLRSSATAIEIREAHPEVLFWAFNGFQPLRHSKKKSTGFEQRLELLSMLYPPAGDVACFSLQEYRRKELAADDILDALVGAVAARLGPESWKSLPETPEYDLEGLRMEIVYADPSRPSRSPDVNPHRTPPLDRN